MICTIGLVEEELCALLKGKLDFEISERKELKTENLLAKDISYGSIP